MKSADPHCHDSSRFAGSTGRGFSARRSALKRPGLSLSHMTMCMCMCMKEMPVAGAVEAQL